MIKLKHLKHFVINAFQAGNGTVATIGGIIAPWNGKVLDVAAGVKTAGTTLAQTFDVLINGTSIWATAGNKPSIATTPAVASTQLTIDGTKTFVKGDLIEVIITAAHTTPAVDSYCRVVLEHQPSALSDFVQL